MYISRYLAPEKPPWEILRTVYELTREVSEVARAHAGRCSPPFALKINGKTCLSIWGEAEEVFSREAARHGFEPVSCITAERLKMFTPREDVVVFEHMTPTTFNFRGRKVPMFLPGIYFLRPILTWKRLTGQSIYPEWKSARAFNMDWSTWDIKDSGFVEGFTGRVRFCGCNNDLKLMAAFSEHCGIGYKTAWGMGGVQLCS
ncbi:MAG: CRISPR system precrRNA processing endoribonuclease RAMP protein Cas6 [Peptococcaceae bacterium]|nr:CRISPR system precrRNA processing endoribonuclease RAMP protein Cas6 [Peptococcaceae bacterium]